MHVCCPPSREEWEWLQSLQEGSNKAPPPSQLVKVFQDQLRRTVDEFLQELALPQEVSTFFIRSVHSEPVVHREHLSLPDQTDTLPMQLTACTSAFNCPSLPPPQDRDGLRLYGCEVVELNEDVSFLVVMPPPERVCMPPGSEDSMTQIGNTITMPIPLFDIGERKEGRGGRGRGEEGRGGERRKGKGRGGKGRGEEGKEGKELCTVLMVVGFCLSLSVQYQTYQQAFLKKYAQLSARLELELAIAQHKRRQVTHPHNPLPPPSTHT